MRAVRSARPARCCAGTCQGPHIIEPKLAKIKVIDEHIDHPKRGPIYFASSALAPKVADSGASGGALVPPSPAAWSCRTTLSSELWISNVPL